jgi:hypothetical protein
VSRCFLEQFALTRTQPRILGQSVLEFGCGLGVHIDAHMRRNNLSRAVCVEPEPMHGVFDAFDGPRQIAEHFYDSQRDVFHLPLTPSNRFDLVFTIEAVEHVPLQHHDLLFNLLARWPVRSLVFSAATPDQAGGVGHVSARLRSEYRLELLSRGLFWDPLLTAVGTRFCSSRNINHVRNIQVFHVERSFVHTACGNIASLHAFLNRISDPARVRRRLTVTMVDARYLTLVLNWLGSARNVGVQNLLVIALDDTVFDFLAELSVPVLHISSFECAESRPLSIVHERGLWAQRLAVLHRLVSCGFEVFHIDADIFFCKNPWEFIISGESEIVSGEGVYPLDIEGSGLNKRRIQGGFTMWSPTDRVQRFLEASLKRLLSVGNEDDQQSLNHVFFSISVRSPQIDCAANLTPNYFVQSSERPSVHFLNQSLFPTGGCDTWPRRDVSQSHIVVMHPTCVEKDNAKKMSA